MIEIEAPEGSHYQAIYKTAAGLDYCRETLASRTLVDAESEANSLLETHGSPSGAVSFKLECW
jgi:hypothetical protein